MQTSARQYPTLPAAEARPKRRFSRALFILPAAAIFALLAVFAVGLRTNPNLVPSPLIGKRVPAFSLPPVRGEKLGLSSRDLYGRVSLVNVFASWCVACREEHPLLMALKERGIVPVNGIDYEDKPADVAAWLKRMGNPYARIGDDASGRVGIDWGVYGVPETFLITRDGRIAYKVIGAITPKILAESLLPKIAALGKKTPAAVRAKAVE